MDRALLSGLTASTMTSNGHSEKPFEKLLIVGAGPSGLLLAILLAQHNIPSLVLEAYPYLDTRLRATQYGVPAPRIFRRAGLLPDFRKASIPKFPAICWRRVADGEKLIEIDMSVVENEEDRMTVLPLGEIIQIMYRHVKEKYAGLIEVRFNHKVTSTGQDDKQAWVNVEIDNQETGEEIKQERLTADYIIGCDGAGSAVRRSLYGKDWPGQTFSCRFMVQNVFYDGFKEHGWDAGNYMIDHDHWGLIAKRGYVEGQGDLWRVTYGDPAVGLTDEEYLARRPWHFKAMLPGNPEPKQYRIEQTNIYNIHNRCVESFKVGRILLAADAAHVCNPMGGYGCMTACLDVGGLADCLIGYYEGKAGEEILETYAKVRRDIFLRYVDARSIKNLERVRSSDPWTVKETDKFFGIIQDLNAKGKDALKDFLLKVSSIEYDFTQHYDRKPNGTTKQQASNGADGSQVEAMLVAEA
ncbi:FAD-dependent monooxygenase terC [Pseudocercospora fuligena]|uniref:FAD-dependent monooxygenase terC n=1 Tax=Pseudocercospora fuligena TaxID=685502 RepID=A0A8H6RIK4_9PEZI|nr:FAD-dependent monooxygenase terC [Pseudocercospora fuligena]